MHPALPATLRPGPASPSPACGPQNLSPEGPQPKAPPQHSQASLPAQTTAWHPGALLTIPCSPFPPSLPSAPHPGPHRKSPQTDGQTDGRPLPFPELQAPSLNTLRFPGAAPGAQHRHQAEKLRLQLGRPFPKVTAGICPVGRATPTTQAPPGEGTQDGSRSTRFGRRGHGRPRAGTAALLPPPGLRV